MSAVLQYDEEASRRVEAIYSTPDVVAVRSAILQALALQPGERVLDIGSGPGFLALQMAEAVGPTGHVTAIDISEPMLAMARARHAAGGAEAPVAFQTADARSLPFPDAALDVAVATQTYEYVSDLPRAFAELYRVIRPGGRALILDTDWDSIVWHSSDRARMERVLAVWNRHLTDPFLPRTLRAQLERAGFRVRHQGVVPLFNPESPPDTYSHLVIGLIESFVLGQGEPPREEVADWVADLRALGATGRSYFSLNRYLAVAEKLA